jgi:hypothetical protein
MARGPAGGLAEEEGEEECERGRFVERCVGWETGEVAPPA